MKKLTLLSALFILGSFALSGTNASNASLLSSEVAHARGRTCYYKLKVIDTVYGNDYIAGWFDEPVITTDEDALAEARSRCSQSLWEQPISGGEGACEEWGCE